MFRFGCSLENLDNRLVKRFCFFFVFDLGLFSISLFRFFCNYFLLFVSFVMLRRVFCINSRYFILNNVLIYDNKKIRFFKIFSLVIFVKVFFIIFKII